MKAFTAAVCRRLVAGLDLRRWPSLCGHTHGSGEQRARGTGSSPIAIARGRHGRSRRSSSCRHHGFTAATWKDTFAATGASCHLGGSDSACTKELWSADHGFAVGPDAGGETRNVVCLCAIAEQHRTPDQLT